MNGTLIRDRGEVVASSPGGGTDLYARILAQHLTEQLKQSFYVEDRPGAGSIIGTDAVAKSAPDGYTLLMMSNTHTVNESLIPDNDMSFRVPHPDERRDVIAYLKSLSR